MHNRQVWAASDLRSAMHVSQRDIRRVSPFPASNPYLKMKIWVAGVLVLQAAIASSAAVNGHQMDPSDAFFTNGVIANLRIDLDPAAVESLQQNSRRYVRATVTEGTTVYSDVGLHLKGNVTFQFLDQKPSLTLNFDKFVQGQKFHGLDKFHLNNSMQDPTYMNELIGGELFRAAGIPAPRVTHARVRLNRRDLGLYVLIEGFDRTFLRRHFAEPNGNCYDGGEKTDIMDPLARTSGDGPADRSDLKILLDAVQAPRSNRLVRLQATLDLDRFYSFVALETLTCHWDGYVMARNNYRLYRHPVNGRFVFLPHGMDQLFGRPQATLLPDCAGVVAWSVLSTPGGRQRHRERCVVLFTNLFSTPRLTNRITALHQRLRPLLAEIGFKETRKHDQAVEVLRQQIVGRVRFLEAQLLAAPLNPVHFDSRGEAQLATWTPYTDGGEANLSEVEKPRPALQVRNIGVHIPFVASWRTRVLLPPDHYRFEASISASELMPMPNAPGGGVCLRGWGQSPSPVMDWAGNVESRRMTSAIHVTEQTEEVELVCEVRAFKGTVFIDKSSLKLVRLRAFDPPGP